MIEIISAINDIREEDIQEIEKAASFALEYEKRKGDLSIQIDSPEHIHELNLQFRNVDRVTDVLTFPSWEGDDPLSGDGYLGDIMICYERAIEQAKEYGHSLKRELAFLTVHGILHLLGYDHILEADEIIMRAKQTAILNEMGIMR